jgi:hypothetical protein
MAGLNYYVHTAVTASAKNSPISSNEFPSTDTKINYLQIITQQVFTPFGTVAI